ncbi:hypothetical protein [Tsukamurella pseudospumae]|uniref:Integral membrane protein n=1 Tax=Tsukamurella pseudospumae TaxID=239498 RepID=A0A137YZG5_9ACTN|nr:hypothetical protein [Tsukamurella pseudospumae]KXO91342.1 hypothetical protein AXK61_07270 [Tsukamurella pseudospumae]
MNSGAITFLGVRVPRLPRPDPMRVAWYAQVPVAAVLLAGALSPVRLPSLVLGVGVAACVLGAGAVIVAWRLRQISGLAVRAAVGTFVQAVLNGWVLSSMALRDGGPSLDTRILWGVLGVMLVINSAVTLNTWRR